MKTGGRWMLKADKVEHENGITEAHLIVCRFGCVNIDCDKIVELMNKNSTAISQVELSKGNRGSILKGPAAQTEPLL